MPKKNDPKNAKERTENLDRKKEKGLVNEETGSSISVRENGNINITASRYASYKQDPDGLTQETSFESRTVTNRKSTVTDEVVLNKHKENPDLHERTDKREFGSPNTAIGGLTVDGSYLVKTYDRVRDEMVFIRRPARVPLYSYRTAPPKIPDEMSIE